jgi:peptidyl-prolyl cis-trans isomerase SurA
LDQLKSQIEDKIMQDERGKYAEESFVAGLKKVYNFKAYPKNILKLAGLIDSSLYTGNWNPSSAGDLIEPVFTINSKEYPQKFLADYIAQTRLYNKKEGIQAIVDKKSNELVATLLIQTEKGMLEDKYPAFNNLMKEYHDGILLFNIMDKNVWSKAVSDSAGLLSFYEQHTNDYQWQERADVSVYTLYDEAYLKLTTSLGKKRAREKWPANEFVKMVCASDTLKCVEVSDHKYERGEPVPSGDFTWVKGAVKTVHERNAIKVIVVNALIPPMAKSFGEIQGQVTADYQNYLDKQWTETLREKYPVSINPAVLQQVK